MAGKARRAASRQGQLKRKKQTKGPSGIPSTGHRLMAPGADEDEDVPISTSEANIDSEAPSTAKSAANTPVAHSSSGRIPRGEPMVHGQGRLRGERPAAYLYVGSEFRRILTLTSAVFAALIVLGIVL